MDEICSVTGLPKKVLSKHSCVFKARDSLTKRIQLAFKIDYEQNLRDKISLIKYVPRDTFIKDETIVGQTFGTRNVNTTYTHTSCYFHLPYVLKAKSLPEYLRSYNHGNVLIGFKTQEEREHEVLMVTFPFFDIFRNLEYEVCAAGFPGSHRKKTYPQYVKLLHDSGVYKYLMWKAGRFYGAMRADLPRVYAQNALPRNLPKGFRKQVAQVIHRNHGPGPIMVKRGF
jgi:hypothetical protein